jgi:hypothetical protein
MNIDTVPCHRGMKERPQVADGGDGLQIQKETANIFDKQYRTADKGWPSSLVAGRGAINSSPCNRTLQDRELPGCC